MSGWNSTTSEVTKKILKNPPTNQLKHTLDLNTFYFNVTWYLSQVVWNIWHWPRLIVFGCLICSFQMKKKAISIISLCRMSIFESSRTAQYFIVYEYHWRWHAPWTWSSIHSIVKFAHFEWLVVSNDHLYGMRTLDPFISSVVLV